MRKLYITVLIFLVISIYGQEFYHDSEVTQGTPVTFVISPTERGVDYTFSLYNKKGTRVLCVQGFNYYLYGKKASIVLGLGGVPVDLPAGSYKLVAKGVGDIHTYSFERVIDVIEGEFSQVILTANDKMDSIINGVRAPERDSQAKRLWVAISSFSPYFFYEEGTLTQPIEGRHTSPFGFKRVTQYPSGKESTSYHKGEDLATKLGTPILSDGKGRVVLAEERIVTGNTVVIEHLPGVKTLYYHMDSIAVNRGDVVDKGSKIGEVGTTGFSTGPHLHWEVRFSSVPVDPKLFIDRPLIDKILIMNMISSTNKKRGG